MNSKYYFFVRRRFHQQFLNSFVPKNVEPDKHVVRSLYDHLRELNGRYLILTGAGVSTESGIPDYRSENVGRFARSTVRPIQYHQVVKSPQIRRRYWARNYVAYKTFSAFEPNTTHRILADWERENRFYYLLTQNVDFLHQKAGNRRVIDMHGSMTTVRCLNCSWKGHRQEFQSILEKLNADYLRDVEPTAIAPDGDVDLPESKYADFQLPSCPECQHDVVLPDVIFFGDNMPESRRLSIDEKVDVAEGLLILGSTISVQSAFRIVKRMFDRKRFIGIVNIGTTCVDHMATVRVAQSKCSDVLTLLNEFFKDENAPGVAVELPLHAAKSTQQASLSIGPLQIGDQK